jgi:cell division protein FtsW (lipid II flippase)
VPLLLFGLYVTLVYVATQRLTWIAAGLLLFCAGSYSAYLIFPHVRERITIWLHPMAHATGSAYQLVQGMFGLADGGIFGTGLGRGSPQVVPYASTDFITASLGEELGLTGLTALLLCYLLIAARGLHSALAVSDGFGKLLATGCSFTLAFQVFVVAGGVTRLIPLTGMTLPWLSYGGSSLVSEFLLLALLLRVSDASRTPPAGEDPTRDSEADQFAGAAF